MRKFFVCFLCLCLFFCGCESDVDRVETVKTEMKNFLVALEFYRNEFGKYPSEDEGLKAILGKVYCRNLKDPWGNFYQYKLTSNEFEIIYSNKDGTSFNSDIKFEIICFGKDGRPGGTGFNSDIKFCRHGERTD